MSNALTKARNGGELTDYVPTDGLKIIAAAEVAEKYWRRAKDPAGQQTQSNGGDLDRLKERIAAWAKWAKGRNAA